MRTDDAKVCEGIMRDFPKMRATLRALEQMAVSPSGDGERVDGGESVPAAQRMLEDRRIAELAEVVAAIERAVRELPGSLQKAVILVYMLGWKRDYAADELHCNERTIWRWCRASLLKMSPTLLRLYSAVLDWRLEYEKELLDWYTDKVVNNLP